MELVMVFVWTLVLLAAIALAASAKWLANKVFPVNKKRPGGAGTPTKGKRHMTEVVYQIVREMSR